MDDARLDHERRLAAVEESVRAAHKRIEEIKGLNESVNNLTRSVATMAEKLDHVQESNVRIENRVCETDKRLNVIEQKPAKRWEAVIMQIIQLLVAGGLGYLLSHILG